MRMGCCIIFVLTLALALAPLGCKTTPPKTAPVENVRFPTDVPLPPDFIFAPADPAPKTNEEGRRFYRYGHVRETAFSLEECAKFCRENLPKQGWTLENDNGVQLDNWMSRWRKGQDILRITCTRKAGEKDGASITLWHLLVEINAP